MTTTVSKDLAALEMMTIGELHDRYAELFGERIQSRHRIYLVRRIAWRNQANAEGGLSERARVRAAQLANPTDVRRTPPKWATLGEAPKDAKKVALAALPLAVLELDLPHNRFQRHRAACSPPPRGLGTHTPFRVREPQARWHDRVPGRAGRGRSVG